MIDTVEKVYPGSKQDNDGLVNPPIKCMWTEQTEPVLRTIVQLYLKLWRRRAISAGSFFLVEGQGEMIKISAGFQVISINVRNLISVSGRYLKTHSSDFCTRNLISCIVTGFLHFFRRRCSRLYLNFTFVQFRVKFVHRVSTSWREIFY